VASLLQESLYFVKRVRVVGPAILCTCCAMGLADCAFVEARGFIRTHRQGLTVPFFNSASVLVVHDDHRALRQMVGEVRLCVYTE